MRTEFECCIRTSTTSSSGGPCNRLRAMHLSGIQAERSGYRHQNEKAEALGSGPFIYSRQPTPCQCD